MEANMRARGSADRYGRVAVALHWAGALFVMGALLTGFQAAGLADSYAKVVVLRAHAGFGILTAASTLARLGWWWIDRRPEQVVGTGKLQARAASATHLLLYLLLVAMAASGIAMLALSGAATVLSGAEAPASLPDFWDYSPRLPHGAGARLLIALVVLHIGAAFYHHFIRRDGLLRRMWF
jgi:cytochrome b561